MDSDFRYLITGNDDEVYDEVQTRPQLWSKPNRGAYCSEKARPSDKPSECAPMCSTLPHNMRLNGLQEGKDNRKIMLCVSTTKINHFFAQDLCHCMQYCKECL